MFGRYLGQISARIGRAWVRPRAPIGSTEFSCWVKIEQDERGVIREVELQRCNGNAKWQVSLAQAVEAASPLPAPPDASVFAKTLTFEMRSDGFDPSGPGDGFEPVPMITSSLMH